jgi:hypothetical protein
MKRVLSKTSLLFIFLTAVIFILSACNEWAIPGDLPGTYAGEQRVLIRYDRGGQYIYRDKTVLVSLNIDKSGNVTGMVGEAAFESCKVIQNRGWIGRQLGLRTDFLVKGMLVGNTFDKDTIVHKDINIPFNIESGELKGSLILISNGENFPIIRVMKLKRL